MAGQVQKKLMVDIDSFEDELDMEKASHFLNDNGSST